MNPANDPAHMVFDVEVTRLRILTEEYDEAAQRLVDWGAADSMVGLAAALGMFREVHEARQAQHARLIACIEHRDGPVTV